MIHAKCLEPCLALDKHERRLTLTVTAFKTTKAAAAVMQFLCWKCWLVSFFPSLSCSLALPHHWFFSLRFKKRERERDFGSSGFCLAVKVKAFWVTRGLAGAWRVGLVGSLWCRDYLAGSLVEKIFLSLCPVPSVSQDAWLEATENQWQTHLNKSEFIDSCSSKILGSWASGMAGSRCKTMSPIWVLPHLLPLFCLSWLHSKAGFSPASDNSISTVFPRK